MLRSLTPDPACSIRLAPPLVITEEDVAKIVSIIRASLEDLETVSSISIIQK